MKISLKTTSHVENNILYIFQLLHVELRATILSSEQIIGGIWGGGGGNTIILHLFEKLSKLFEVFYLTA